jgi:hypothetical protein
MDATVSAIQEMTPTVLVTVGLMLVIGIALWAAGRHVLKPCVAIMGGILGGAAGLAIGEQVSFGVPVWAISLAGCTLLACLAVLLYRVVITMTLAIVIATAAPMSLLAVSEWQGDDAETVVVAGTVTEETVDPLTAFFNRDRSGDMDAVAESLELASELSPETVDPDTVDRLNEARTFVERLIEDARETWESTPARLRGPILVSAVIGLLVGLVLGTFAPTASTSIVTAFGGSLLWLTGLHTVLVHVGEPAAQIMPNTPTATAVVWLAIALFGVLIQWIFRTKPADTSP